MPVVPGKIAVVLNADSGAGKAAAAQSQLEEVFRAAGREVVTTVTSGDRLPSAVREAVAAGASVVVGGGGDGTLNSIASALVGGDIPLGVVPLGTLNHFARDLELPLEVEAAAAIVLTGHTVRVDVGEVNGRIFLNNSSLGLYPAIVKLRELRPAKGLGKWAVAIWATIKALRRNMILSVRLEVDGQSLSRRTPVVFVGNNQYTMAGFQAGQRDSLTGGRLAVYVVNTVGRMQHLRLAWKVLTGGAHRSDELDMRLVSEATIESAHRVLAVSFDGEVADMPGPYHYRVRPKALPVCLIP